MTRGVGRDVRSAFSLVPALACVGCWAGGGQLKPGTAPSGVPSPTLMTRAVDCRGNVGDQAAGKTVAAQTDYGAQMLSVVDGGVLSFGPALPPFSSSVCGSLFDADAQDSDDWSAPRPPIAIARLLERYDAKSVLVPAVISEWRCVSAGELSTSCTEASVTVVAYLFTTDGVIWKSRAHRGIGNETPDLAGGVEKLFEDAPPLAAAPLQDEQAPTYERALEEAGVAP